MSQYYSILVAAKNALAALPGFVGATFSIRKRPFCSTDHGDVLPFVCLSYDAEAVGDVYTTGVWIDYPVWVTLFQAKGAECGEITSEQYQLDRREDVRVTLYKGSLATDPPVMDCTRYDPDPAWNTAGLDQAFDVSQQKFTFRNVEARS
ncbi:MAG: hypothetical protein LC745_01500 [Planctomycetia bacterium]|nr:hypothetical protein [Planctomycetia bacterium]